jgi:hypothetical protein
MRKWTTFSFLMPQVHVDFVDHMACLYARVFGVADETVGKTSEERRQVITTVRNSSHSSFVK